MCGIFGVILTENAGWTSTLLKNTINKLLVLSESRGKAATGFAVLQEDRLDIHKDPVLAHYFIRRKKYARFLEETIGGGVRPKKTGLLKKPISIIGHTRLATNGSEKNNDNNSPIVSGNVTGVHNGIIVNDGMLWEKFLSIRKKAEVDSAVIFALLDLFYKNGVSLPESVGSVFKNIEGSASIAGFVRKSAVMVLATNTGSLYYCKNAANNAYIFASEFPILKQLIGKLKLQRFIGEYHLLQLRAKQAHLVNIYDLTEQRFDLN